MTETVSINFRLPSDLHADLVKKARAGGRSLNKEIIGRLTASLTNGSERLEFVRTAKARAVKASSVDAPADTEARLANLEKGLAALLGAIADLDNRLTQSNGGE